MMGERTLLSVERHVPLSVRILAVMARLLKGIVLSRQGLKWHATVCLLSAQSTGPQKRGTKHFPLRWTVALLYSVFSPCMAVSLSDQPNQTTFIFISHYVWRSGISALLSLFSAVCQRKGGLPPRRMGWGVKRCVWWTCDGTIYITVRRERGGYREMFILLFTPLNISAGWEEGQGLTDRQSRHHSLTAHREDISTEIKPGSLPSNRLIVPGGIAWWMKGGMGIFQNGVNEVWYLPPAPIIQPD